MRQLNNTKYNLLFCIRKGTRVLEKSSQGVFIREKEKKFYYLRLFNCLSNNA